MDRVILGASTAIVADKTGEKLYGKPYLEEHGPDIHADIKKMACSVEQLAECLPRPPIYKRVVLQPGYLVPMENEGDRFYNVCLVNAMTQIVFEIVGQGQVTFTLDAGWNVLNMPPETNWGLPSGASSNVNVLYVATDVMFGSAFHG